MQRSTRLAAIMTTMLTMASSVAHAQDSGGDIEHMSLEQLQDFEKMLNAPLASQDEVCAGASEDDDEEAYGTRFSFCVERTGRYTVNNPNTGEDEIADIVVQNWVSLNKTGSQWANNVSVKIIPVQGNVAYGLTIAPEIYCGVVPA